ncbi:MAG: winged helix-turn-helix transcriptional regulator [Proteobacteria bacterium]|nr:winged helix-turn-helix transcriptional regulator [Pseudomonadota bacterium]
MKVRTLTPAAVRSFQKTIYQYFSTHARDLPWRNTDNPYHILVSEIMLQQTQVERVIEKYGQFIKQFPDFYRLSRAPLRKILMMWQGLGYNRRAIALKQIAQRVVEEFHGHLPSDVEVLKTFPGIGEATAGAVAAFAFNQPAIFLETNIRRVFIHHFFSHKATVRDTEILPLIKKTLYTSNPRKWYYALMDYGVMLKKEQQNPNRKSAHYQKQSPFEGSNRQIRGMILRALMKEAPLSKSEIAKIIGRAVQDINDNLVQLQKEGFIKKTGRKFTIL